jgi:hypothetical protein
LEKKGIAYQALDNGFLSCAEPNELQEICDSLGPEQIERLFRKWLSAFRCHCGRRIVLPVTTGVSPLGRWR